MEIIWNWAILHCNHYKSFFLENKCSDYWKWKDFDTDKLTLCYAFLFLKPWIRRTTFTKLHERAETAGDTLHFFLFLSGHIITWKSDEINGFSLLVEYQPMVHFLSREIVSLSENYWKQDSYYHRFATTQIISRNNMNY